MINVEKTITDNPFVDNMIYYAKYLALNCNIKDEDEALANETVDSLRNGQILTSDKIPRANEEGIKIQNVLEWLLDK